MVKLTMEDIKSHLRIQSDLSAVVTSMNGLGQGDALVCLLFNIALQKIAKDADILTNDKILYKSVQLLAYADDRGIIVRSQTSLKDAFLTLEGAARRKGLRGKKKEIYDYKSECKGKQEYNYW
jgi:sorting nexin-29